MMALPVLRCCSCNVSRPLTVFTRAFKPNCLLLNRLDVRRTVPLASVISTVRNYSSEGGGQKQNKVVVVGIPNPFMWFRTRIYYFLIRTYFDKEFNIEDFTDGAKQVCVNVCWEASCLTEFVIHLTCVAYLGNLVTAQFVLPMGLTWSKW